MFYYKEIHKEPSALTKKNTDDSCIVSLEESYMAMLYQSEDPPSSLDMLNEMMTL